MRDRIDHYLVMAMVVAEAVRGTREVMAHFRRRNGETAANTGTRPSAAERRRARVMGVALGVVAIVPVLYYTAHAVAAGALIA